MNYIFFGTPDFAAIILEKLVYAGMVPARVVANPDRPAGRKKIITPPPVKQLILDNAWNIPLIQPENLSKSDFDRRGADVGVLAAYGKIIPQEIIDLFPKGIIAVHPSLLPRYRGATPIQTAILNGDAETGTTLFVMDEKIDHGKTISHAQCPISNEDTYETLVKKLADMSANLLIHALPRYMRGEIKPQAQDDAQATYTKKFTAQDGFVDLEKDAPEKIGRMVRALNPEPGVYTVKDAKRIKILDAEVREGNLVFKKIQFAGEMPKIVFERIPN